MQQAPMQFEDKTFVYTQLARQGSLALYRQDMKTSGVTRYEVVRIKVLPAHLWPNGDLTPEHEKYPSAKAWGRDGWTFYTLPDAEAALRALVAAQMSLNDCPLTQAVPLEELYGPDIALLR